MPKSCELPLERDVLLEKALLWIVIFGTLLMLATPAFAGLIFSTGNPDGKVATASRPQGNGKIEIESADDFVLTQHTVIDSATFTGLLTGLSPSVTQVIVEIYRIFPKDSDTVRIPNVTTRTNSPSDVEFDGRDSAIAGELSFTTQVVSQTFTAANSVLNGINPKPNQLTHGEGAVTGEEVQFNVAFDKPIDLPPDHYLFVPQVLTGDASNEFFWLSAPKPVVPPGTPFPLGFTDLQSWIRNANLDPDWSRIGTDIIGPPATGGPAPTFNAAFSISGQVPEPGTLVLFGAGVIALWGLLRRRS